MSKIFERSLSERQNVATSLLESAVLRGRLANAYLLTGRNTEDKWLIARQLASYLNCMSRADIGGQYCLSLKESKAGEHKQLCQNCRWIADNQHPQAWLMLSGEETSKTGKIPVEKARLLSEELGKTSQYVRVVVIPDAGQDILHRPAGNALLKTIEEPGPDCLFLLFTAAPEDVLPTILSRCQVIPVLKPGAAGSWLEESDNSLASALDPNVDMRRASLSQGLDWSSALLEVAQQGAAPHVIIDIVVSREVERFRATAAEDPAISLYLSRLVALAETSKQQIEHFVQPKFVLESWAISWHKLGSKR